MTLRREPNTVANAWLVDSTVYVFVALFLFGLSAYQRFEIVARRSLQRRPAAPPVPLVRSGSNAVVLCVAGIMVVRSVDIHGALGVYELNLRDALARCCGVQLQTLFLSLQAANIQAGLSMLDRPFPAASWAAVASVFTVLLSMAVASMLARIWTTSAYWGHGFFMTFMLCSTLCGVASVLYAEKLLLRALAVYRRGMETTGVGGSGPAGTVELLEKAARRLGRFRRLVLAVCVVLVPLQLAAAVLTAMTDETLSEFNTPDYSRYDVTYSAMPWIEAVAVGIFVWFAWVSPWVPDRRSDAIKPRAGPFASFASTRIGSKAEQSRTVAPAPVSSPSLSARTPSSVAAAPPPLEARSSSSAALELAGCAASPSSSSSSAAAAAAATTGHEERSTERSSGSGASVDGNQDSTPSVAPPLLL